MNDSRLDTEAPRRRPPQLPASVGLCPNLDHMDAFYVPHAGPCPEAGCEHELFEYVTPARYSETGDLIDTPNPEELIRWADKYGHPEWWAKRAQALHGDVERLRAENLRLLEGVDCGVRLARYGEAREERLATVTSERDELARDVCRRMQEVSRLAAERDQLKAERDRWEQAARSRLDGKVLARLTEVEAERDRYAEIVHVYGAALVHIWEEAKGGGEDRLALESKLRNVIVLAKKALNGTTPPPSQAAPGLIGHPAIGDRPADESSHGSEGESDA